jgi:hypothetical protein
MTKDQKALFDKMNRDRAAVDPELADIVSTDLFSPVFDATMEITDFPCLPDSTSTASEKAFNISQQLHDLCGLADQGDGFAYADVRKAIAPAAFKRREEIKKIFSPLLDEVPVTSSLAAGGFKAVWDRLIMHAEEYVSAAVADGI